jgi:hypothetical protein
VLRRCGALLTSTAIQRYGLSIEVPAATILTVFGFDSQAFWFPDVASLAIITGGLWAASLLWLCLFVREAK